MNKIHLIVLTAASLLSAFAIGVVSAKGVPGYVYDSDGNIARNPYGECWTTPYLKKENMVPECHPELQKKEEPAKPVFEKITFNAIALFDFDSARLSAAGRQALDDLVAKMKAHPEVEKISVTGHTCNIGAKDYNQALSERRATSVRDYLVQNGVAAGRIDARGVGMDQPAYSNATRDGRVKNRRVEVEITAQAKK
ncbi:MAG: OmpA family protein [Chromatiales bacterium]|nr:OmpA family protein [Chromatiales bacterium]MDX9765701.1 OmpA family protein [Ectothiorhodospiraceae bacterium]